MRYRNVPDKNTKGLGPQTATLQGRDVRSRTFVKLSTGRRFEMPPESEMKPILTVYDGAGNELKPDESHKPVQWEMPDPIVPGADTFVRSTPPLDIRRGSADALELGKRELSTKSYNITGEAVSLDLNTTSPTATNVSRVLASLIRDLDRRGIIRRVQL
jgi:hypothetical protein